MASLVGRSLILCMNHRVVGADWAVPGRGLEPLRISPPDPKSGASANSATPADISGNYLAQILAQAAPSQQVWNVVTDLPLQTYTRAIQGSDFESRFG